MTSPTYDEIRKQVNRRYNRISWFVFHVIMAIVTTAIIWMIDPTPQSGKNAVAGLWFGVLVCHAFKIFSDGRRDKAVERAWWRVSEYDEKPKRSMRLSDDGELESLDDEPILVRNDLRSQQ